MEDLGAGASSPYPPVADAKNFARYLAARTNNRAVLLSPGFDDRPSNMTDDGQTVGASLTAVPRNRRPMGSRRGRGVRSRGGS